MRLAFIVGKEKIESSQKYLLKEAEIYNDIVQVNLREAYQNLTLKTLASKH